jgi:hypothetical protein
VAGLLAIYLRQMVKGLATKHQFSSAIEQLNASTKVVESIKAQLGEKLWVNQ